MNNTTTLETVLNEYKSLVFPPGKCAKRYGAIVSILGGTHCPWCKDNMTENTQAIGTYIAVCNTNPNHIVEWLPWGG